MVSASCSISTAWASVRSGAGVMVSTQIPLRWTDSVIGYAAAWPDGDRTTRALSSRAKWTNSSAIDLHPVGAGRRRAASRLVRAVELPDALGRRSRPRAVLAITGQPCSVAERDQRGGVGHHPVRRAGRPERGQPVAHDRLVLGVHQRVRPGPDRDPGRLQVAEQPGRHVLVVEGDHVAAGGEGADRLGVGVVAHGDVMHHGGRGHVGPLGEQPDLDAQPDRRRVHHPGQLAAADDADDERSGLVTSGSVTPLERGDPLEPPPNGSTAAGRSPTAAR